MDLKLPITLIDELADDEVRGHGQLDMASGEIHQVAYEGYDLASEGLPASRRDYAFTVGLLAKDGREVEFKVDVDRMTGRYSVTPSELLELKGRAAKLFTQRPGR
jgi:hypothetical protein